MREGDKIKQILDIMSASNDLDTRNKQKKYLVKSYQRGYRWGTSQVYALMRDSSSGATRIST